MTIKKLEYNTDYGFNLAVRDTVNKLVDSVSGGSPTVQTLSDAVELAELEGISVGDTVTTNEYHSGTGLGGNKYQLVDGQGSRPSEDGGSVVHVGSGDLYLKGLFILNHVRSSQFGVANSAISELERSQRMINSLNYVKANNLMLDMSGTDCFLTPDTFTIENNESLVLYSNSPKKPKLRPVSDGNSLITMSRHSYLKMTGIEFDCTSQDCGVLSGSSDVAPNPDEELLLVDIDRCIFDVSNNNKNAISLRGYKGRCSFTNNTFKGNNAPDVEGEYFNLQTLLALPDAGTPAGDKSLITIIGNEFYGGAVQYATFGTDSPPSPLKITHNLFSDAYCRAIHIYHGEDSFVAFNTVINCKGIHATIVDSINAAVWLDQYSPLVEDSREGQVFLGNVVRGCNGVGVFLEETSGQLFGWTVTDTEEFLDDFTYTGNHGYVTAGGIGMVITGGCRGLNIKCRVSGNVQNVVIDHSLGVSTKPRIRNITLSGQYESARKESILVRNEVESLKILDASMIKNSSFSAGTYDAIHIERDVGQQGLTSLRIRDVDFTDRVSPVSHRHCIGKSYSGLRIEAKDNLFDSQSEWINSGGTISGSITQNECLNGRGFLLSGSDRWYEGNSGFSSEAYDRINMTAANGLVEWTYPTLSAGSASRAQVTIVNSTSPIFPVTNRVSNKLQIRVFNADGTTYDGSVNPVQLSVGVFSGGSIAG